VNFSTAFFKRETEKSTKYRSDLEKGWKKTTFGLQICLFHACSIEKPTPKCLKLL
jgi:hypothetical protein